MTTSFDVLAIRRRLGAHLWGPPTGFGPDGWKLINRAARGSIVLSCDDYDAVDWVHASIAFRDRMPTYQDLKGIHLAVFRGGWAYQVFAPPAQHVNLHEYALHLFGRLDGQPGLPDFTRGTGSL
jgi:hypothetical protein